MDRRGGEECVRTACRSKSRHRTCSALHKRGETRGDSILSAAACKACKAQTQSRKTQIDEERLEEGDKGKEMHEAKTLRTSQKHLKMKR
jgi:hypothetical protein